MKKPDITIADYDYNLPADRIAKYPLQERENSKLLVYKDDAIQQHLFRDLPGQLPTNAMLVFNNTKVIRARLLFFKPTGARIELFCLEPHAPSDTAIAFSQSSEVEWHCMVGNQKKWKDGIVSSNIETNDGIVTIEAHMVKKNDEGAIIRFKWNNDQLSFAGILECLGKTPIPPYLERASEAIDTERYQTVYSKYDGSVAAPTAGLHFSDNILLELDQKNHKRLELTLHVGAGTFKPVKSDSIAGHEMHTEHFEVDASTLHQLIEHKDPIIAVGTTTVRTLESLYYAGVKLSKNINHTHIDQWDGFTLESSLSAKQSLILLLEHLKKSGETKFKASTSILIAPGYHFHIIDGLITNFHQPRSTLLLLIAAITGNKWKDIYNYAMNNNFRFLSYGDSSLILR